MSGEMIKKIKRIDDKMLYIYLRNGDILKIAAVMCDYDDCELQIKKLLKE